MERFQYQYLMAPPQLFPCVEYDMAKHTIDEVAQQYLTKASKSVQHLIPIQSIADGNCLFNSVVMLTSDSGVSAIELRGLFVFYHSSRHLYRDNAMIISFQFDVLLNSSGIELIMKTPMVALSVLSILHFVERATIMSFQSYMSLQHWPVCCNARYMVYTRT